MDIKSIIDAEDTPAVRKPSITVAINREYRGTPAGISNTQPSLYDNRCDIRPPEPLPLQTPTYNGSHFPSASPKEHSHSPYQRTPSFGHNSGQYSASPFSPPSSHITQQTLQYPPRESNSGATGVPSGRSFGQITPLSQTPTASTPGSASAYSNFPRPTSSHSIPTPNSTQHSSSFFRESSQPPHTQSRTFSQPQGSQQYVSQPGTPLGPPSTHGRPGFNYHRESPGSYDHQRSPSSGPTGQQRPGARPPIPIDNPPAHPDHIHHRSRERESSVSVSPKTRLPSLPSINQTKSVEGPSDLVASAWNRQATPAKSNQSDIPGFDSTSEPKPIRTPSRSVGVSGLLNAEPSVESPETIHRTPQTKTFLNKEEESDLQILGENISGHHYSSSPLFEARPLEQHSSPQTPSAPKQHSGVMDSSPQPTLRSTWQPEMVSSFKLQALQKSNGLIDSPLPPAHKPSREARKTKRKPEQPAETEIETAEIAASTNSQPVKKKPRLVEPQQDPVGVATEKSPLQRKSKQVPRIRSEKDVPLFAQSVRGELHTKELFERNLRGALQGSSTMTQMPRVTSAASARTNGFPQTHHPAPPTNGIHVPAAQPLSLTDGPLGPWEYNIINTLPAEELTRTVSDFLFENVVLRNDVGVAPAGGGRGLGAVLEIEAKIGQLIDLNTNDRLQLPVMTECVLDHQNPNMRTAFKSSMTEGQHRTLNEFLNTATGKSKIPSSGGPQSKPRIPMEYKHTKETDTFYELSQQGALQLPQSVANGLQVNPRSTKKARVRITTDDKTGEELAKIVKTNVVNMEIYSPRTLFDWRISVNVETDFDIDKNQLIDAVRKDGKAGDRRKDRVSYKHLAYQIDLTQVTPAEPVNKFDKEHELEIEVSSADIRKHGQLVLEQKPNGYEDLVKGFVDNVRLLVRHCKD